MTTAEVNQMRSYLKPLLKNREFSSCIYLALLNYDQHLTAQGPERRDLSADGAARVRDLKRVLERLKQEEAADDYLNGGN